MNCKNCNAEINSNFCPECGQPASLKRIDRKYIIHEIEHVLHFERGILYTIRELITNPGQSIRNYLYENRSRLVKPIIFIILTSLIYSLTVSIFHFEDGYIKFEGDETQMITQFKITKWIQSHYGYAHLIMGVFIAFWIKLFFRKQPYNIYEIVILLCFIMGMGILILAFFGMFEGLIHLKILQFGVWVSLFYTTWAIGQFYGKREIIAYVKAFIAYISGYITFIFSAIVLGVLIDIIKGL